MSAREALEPPLLLLRQACLEPRQHQEKILRRILSSNNGAQVLRRAGCQRQAARAPELSPAELGALLDQLPLTTYADYQPAVAAALAAAEAQDSDGFSLNMARVCGQPATALWCSSGTTGPPKVLPETAGVVEEQQKMFIAAHCLLKAAHPEALEGLEVRLAYGGMVHTLKNSLLQGVNTYISWRRLAATAKSDPIAATLLARFASPLGVITAGEAGSAYYLHWLCALAQRSSITMLSDTFTANVYQAANILWTCRSALLHDLREGTACASWRRAELAPGLPPLPAPGPLAAVNQLLQEQRGKRSAGEWEKDVAAIEQAFAGGEAGLLDRLFHRLRLIMCVATASMSKYAPLLQAMAPLALLLSPGYSATECVAGLASSMLEAVMPLPGAEIEQQAGATEAPSPAFAARGPGPTAAVVAAPKVPATRETYVLLPHISCFYEFLSLEDGSLSRLQDVKEGRCYEVVVSNMQGLLRYRLGDAVRCRGFYGAAPKFTFVGRIGQALNIANEKTSEELVVAAVACAAMAVLPWGCLDLKDWVAAEQLHTGTVQGKGSGHYMVYWELHESVMQDLEGEGLAVQQQLLLGGWASALHAAFRQCSPAYAGYSAEGQLGPAEVRVVRPGAFAALRQEAIARGGAAGQHKPPVVATKGWQRQVLEAWRWSPGGGTVPAAG